MTTKKPRRPSLKRKPVDVRLRSPKTHNGPGRPRHAVTDATKGLVTALILLGATQDQISVAADIDLKTLRKHYRHELDRAYLLVGASLMQTSIIVAQGGPKPDRENAHPGMLQYLLTRRYGLKEPPQQLQHTGANGGPMEFMDISKLDDDELRRLAEIRAKLTAAGGIRSGDGEEGA